MYYTQILFNKLKSCITIDKKEQTIDSKYIQQHLANESTYLAWIRTIVAVNGVGFLITNLHLSTISVNIFIGDRLAQIIGYTSILVGIIVLLGGWAIIIRCSKVAELLILLIR